MSDAWLIDIPMFPTPTDEGEFTALEEVTVVPQDDPNPYPLVRKSTQQYAQVGWDIGLSAGTWTIEMIHHTGPDNGIYQFSIDSTTCGTIDGYADPGAANERGFVTGITVGTTGKVRLSVQMDAKNTNSGDFYGAIQHLQLRRTA